MSQVAACQHADKLQGVAWRSLSRSGVAFTSGMSRSGREMATS